MKTLKFRVWDGEKMRYDVTGFEYGGGKDYSMTGVFLDGDYYKISEAPTMQYTGRNDDYGNKIWEGDFIVSEDFLPSEVTYEDGDEGGYFHAEGLSFSDMYDGAEGERGAFRLKVIGNKFEDELCEECGGTGAFRKIHGTHECNVRCDKCDGNGLTKLK